MPLGALLVFLAVVLTAPAQAEGPPPASAFAELPSIQHPALSPDGTHLAYSSHQGAERYVVLLNLDTGERTALGASHVRVEGLYWVGDRHVVVRAGSPRNMMFVRGVVDLAQLIAFDIESQRFRRLVRQTRNMGFNPDMARIQAIDHEQGRVLIRAFSTSGMPDLYWVDVASGGFRRYENARSDTSEWILDSAQRTVARIEGDPDEGRDIWVRRGRDYQRLERPDGARRLIAVHGLDSTGARLIASERRRGQLASVISIPLDGQGADAIVFQSAEYELSDVIQESYTNAVLGVELGEIYARPHWFDETLAQLQNQIETSLDADAVAIHAWSRDRSVAVIEVEHADAPPDIYIYRRSEDGEGRLDGPLHTNETVSATPLPRRESITYAARDGVQIPGYMTLPEGPGPHPFVILPHGGPAARDYGGYDYFAHFLASRGYGVMQPNFRGSPGYGLAWRNAGHGEWGLGVMQHDVSDAVEALVEGGLADPARICIAGGSYGGYAALAGAAFTPELYNCAISINGVSSLQDMLSYTRDRYGPRSRATTYWRRSILNETDESSMRYLRDRSPADNAQTVRAAILLIHGRDDSVVPAAQSRRMASALQRQGVDVRLVEQRSGDHWLTGYEARRETLEEIETFLAARIGDGLDAPVTPARGARPRPVSPDARPAPVRRRAGKADRRA